MVRHIVVHDLIHNNWDSRQSQVSPLFSYSSRRYLSRPGSEGFKELPSLWQYKEKKKKEGT